MEEDINECGGSLEEIGTSFTSSEPRSRIENAEQAYVIASQQKKKDDARQYEYAIRKIKEAAESGKFEYYMYEYLSKVVCEELKEKGFEVTHEYAGTTTIKWRKKKKKKLFRRKILPLPKPKKIFKRGLYELMWGAKKRDYGERCSPKKGKRREL